uniref:Uncharacterized protein LOC111110938 n=1 Tax=Crassostrea virginica TaxID=6565 RepID=A0A8B8BJ53_CRAVI|nr:uncharacterized protein LOC111110938 [Crassostrea virginica]
MATRSISSTNRRNFPSTSTLRDAAEEMTGEKEMGFSDGESGYRAFWICFKECFLCCFTPSSCSVNALANRQKSISSIALSATCSTPSTFGRAIIKVVESSMGKNTDKDVS